MTFDGAHGIIGRRYVAPSSPFPSCAGRALAERDDDAKWKERPSNNRDCWAFPNYALGLPTGRFTDGTVRSAGDEVSARGEQTDVHAIDLHVFIGRCACGG